MPVFNLIEGFYKPKNPKNPETTAKNFLKRYKFLVDAINGQLSLRQRGKLSWPDWCFLPTQQYLQILDSYGLPQIGDNLLKLHYETLTELFIFATWDFSKGVYTFAPEIYEEIKATPYDGCLPTEVLTRLPEWCIYVETPGMMFLGANCYGFWASCDYSQNVNTLVMFFNTAAGFRCVEFCLADDFTLDDSCRIQQDKLCELLRKQPITNIRTDEIMDSIRQQYTEAQTYLSLLLYLCSDKNEVYTTDGKKQRPTPPAGIRNYGHISFFPTPNIKNYIVGEDISHEIKKIKESNATNTSERGQNIISAPKTPHLRRGHWHLFYKGPKDDKTPIIHWIYPLIVNSKYLK